jgi:hypothetical protein
MERLIPNFRFQSKSKVASRKDAKTPRKAGGRKDLQHQISNLKPQTSNWIFTAENAENAEKS